MLHSVTYGGSQAIKLMESGARTGDQGQGGAEGLPFSGNSHTR